MAVNEHPYARDCSFSPSEVINEKSAIKDKNKCDFGVQTPPYG